MTERYISQGTGNFPRESKFSYIHNKNVSYTQQFSIFLFKAALQAFFQSQVQTVFLHSLQLLSISESYALLIIDDYISLACVL